MKIDISLPFLTRGKPKRCATERDIYVTMPVTVDVPEVFESETEVAFESFERFHIFADPRGGEDEMLKVQSGVELRAYDGRLYRKLFDVGSIADAAFHVAFDDNTDPKGNDPDVGISTGFGYYGANPLAGALRRQIEWDLEKTSVGDSNVVLAWPNGAGTTARLRARGNAEFPKVAANIDDIDGALSERSMRRIETQSAKLLVIGQDLWVACRPPCWRVSVNDYQVTIDLAIAIEGFDPIMSRRYFPLDRLEDARAYAKKCAHANCAHPGIRITPVEYVVDYEAPMPELLEFDADAEELSRIGYALAVECMRYGTGNRKWMDNLPGELRESLFAAYAAAMEADYVQGKMGDVTPYVEDLCSVWRRFNRPGRYCEIGPVRGKAGDLMIKEARFLAENAPITLGGQFPTLLPSGPGASR
ncbi:hypothetical protein [Rhizobium sp. BK176]|uniref:hypothetical protein n=1 Tax=Rhizobium sp. BK176 TaxID=2587071 RepID=UPI00216A96D7|nr:hypothetical protein [Rhizobium sp. BK176]MCS4089452.1 hypothetical protein [Rhizobium sp. BK176]